MQHVETKSPEGTYVQETRIASCNQSVLQFNRLYIAMSFVKHTWRHSKVFLVAADDTYTTSDWFKHTLLLAVTYDGNNERVLLAFAVTDIENEDNWVWFGTKLVRRFPQDRHFARRHQGHRQQQFPGAP